MGLRPSVQTHNRLKMMKSALFSLAFVLLAPLISASTKVAVIELGKGGSVRRTTSQSAEASVEGVASFWNALHGRRKLQQAGMTVVPDLFNQADSSVVIGIKGTVDLEKMPTISGLFEAEGRDHVVGHFEVDGHRADALLSHVKGHDEVSSPVLSVAKKQAETPGLSGMKMSVDTLTVSQIDSEMNAILAEIHESAKTSGTTVVIHLVVEQEDEDDAPVSTHRRLEEAEGEDNQAEEGQQNNGLYGYGYYVDGVWVTPYKTMFQIQYFNVVLWTAIGLVLIVISAIYMMMFMPLEADTLLFGESAKVVE